MASTPLHGVGKRVCLRCLMTHADIDTELEQVIVADVVERAHLVSWGEAFAQATEDRPWIIDGMVRQGDNVAVAGPPGSVVVLPRRRGVSCNRGSGGRVQRT